MTDELCVDTLKINSPNSTSICGFGSMYQFTENGLVDEFDIQSDLLLPSVRELNIFDWISVGLDGEGGVNLFSSSNSNSDQYGWRIQWETENEQNL